MEAKILDSKRIEEHLNLQLKRRIQEYDKLEEEIMQFKKKLDEGSIKSKFENNSRILDGILSSQRPSSDRSGLGFVKEKNPESSPLTN